MGFGVWGLGFRVWGLGFGVWVWGLGFGVWGLGFGVWGLGFGVWGLGFRVQVTIPIETKVIEFVDVRREAPWRSVAVAWGSTSRGRELLFRAAQLNVPSIRASVELLLLHVTRSVAGSVQGVLGFSVVSPAAAFLSRGACEIKLGAVSSSGSYIAPEPPRSWGPKPCILNPEKRLQGVVLRTSAISVRTRAAAFPAGQADGFSTKTG